MPFRTAFFLIIIFFFNALLSGCYRWRGSKGGGALSKIETRTINPADIALHPGYTIEPVISGLNFPTDAAFDDEGRLYVLESGYSYGEVWTEPRLLRVEANGQTTVIATGPRNGPWSGITWHNGAFYVAEGGEMEGGRILRITRDGQITPLIANLPTMGDHHTNGPAIHNGFIYFGQGTATNSGVVGDDNALFGWLKRKPAFHDIPCKDIILSGLNFVSPNPLTDDPKDTASTGSYVPFGTRTTLGQVIPGSIPCSGSVLRIPLAGGKPELVAWGFRNPFGLAFSPEGRLYVTENAYDDRGSRPVWGAGDVLWEVRDGLWYGWPDFSGGRPIYNTEEFKVPESRTLIPLLQQHPNTPPKPAAVFAVHSSSNGLDFSRSDAFGFKGEAFVAQFGDMSPGTGKLMAPVGFKVVRVDVATGIIRDFATNKGKLNGPASRLSKGGLERPVSVSFNPAGDALYIVDFGILKMAGDHSLPQQRTGMVWKVTKR